MAKKVANRLAECLGTFLCNDDAPVVVLVSTHARFKTKIGGKKIWEQATLEL